MARTADKVAIGYVHPTEVGAGFHHSLIGLLLRDIQTSRRVVAMYPHNSSANISNARNKIVAKFLDGPADWLLMVDADMVFEPDTLDRLLDVAHDKTYPIVGALAFGVHQDAIFPTLYFFEDGPDGTVVTKRFDTFPPDSMFQIHATGAAFLLVHRSVFQTVLEKVPADPAYPWFQETSLPGGHGVGEDVTFCIRAGRAGFPVHVHTGIAVGHQKATILTLDKYLDQLARPKEVPSDGVRT